MTRQTLLSLGLILASAAAATAQISWDRDADGGLNPGEFIDGFGNLSTFNRFDRDADGRLNADEWNASLGPVGEYVNMDINADGGVDEAEYNALLFNRYDTDGTGTIDTDELTMIESDLAADGMLAR